ncbi:recombinase family protein [Aminipila luticellarii]|uniref:Recombinase family protein n=1 Tax=Aminipila luticellarii TaxID=2507160 RepID=A0A410PTN7_9FIRM|nr:recombinase family protein [Aminipila luticellarii]QAT42327.1 recombinase family protein [Aminipila luticellarii]
MSKQITTIPARPNQDEKRLKVAAYCRVSTEHEEQRQSLKSQVAYYTQKICGNPDWDFAGIYAEQESGTRVDNREEIQRLMNNCRNGKVDLILMKSLSRFGRNTLDVLLMLDELSKLNVVAYFETENIWSNDPRVKKYITMVAAAYQEESRQKSEAIKWGIRESSRHGHIKLNHSQFLGYGKDTNGNLVIIEEEAKIVRLIYDLFLQGYGCRKIKKYLEDYGIKTVTGKEQWSTSTIDRILSNEKYIGRNITPKTHTPDFLTGKQEENQGQIDTIIIENAHQAIISQEVFEVVQNLKGNIKDKEVIINRICF